MRNHRMLPLLPPLLLVASACIQPAEAATVKILTSTKASTILGADADDDLDAFYRDLGATSSLLTGTVTAAELAGVDLFVAMLPDDAFSTAELDDLASFVANGGTLLLMGEQDGFAATENGYLNGALASLGSAMLLDMASLDVPPANLLDTVPGQIVPQQGLTNGVSIINYGNVNSISGVSPAREIFLASDLSSVWGGFEPDGNGRIILIAEVNIISNLEDTAGNDNHVFLANLAGIETQNTSVKVLTSVKAGMIAVGDGDNDLNDFYQAAGISSSLWPNEVTDEALAGAELLVVMTPDDAFTASELSAMSAFLAAGGRILFMGDQDGFAATENLHINAALSAIGSSLSLGTSSLEPGLQDTVSGQILAHPYNTGVALLNYGNVNTVSGVPAAGGLEGPLFLAKDLTSVWGGVDELGGGGTVILVADLNLLSNLEDEAGNDNHVFFLNIAPAPAAAAPALGMGAGATLAALLACLGMCAGRRARAGR